MFHGYAVVMKGKDPRDSRFIINRICGMCGDNDAATVGLSLRIAT
jgi:Ni,Fe-hydrogenase I large subunit